MGMSLNIKGGIEVVKKLEKLRKDQIDFIQNAVKNSAGFMEGEVKKSIAGRAAEPRSVDTGNFLRSVTFEVKDPVTARVYSDVSYAKDLEYGTSRMAPRSHFRNSLTRNRAKIRANMDEAVKKAASLF